MLLLATFALHDDRQGVTLVEFLFLDLMLHYLYADSGNQYIFSTDIHHRRALQNCEFRDLCHCSHVANKMEKTGTDIHQKGRAGLMSVSQSFASCGLLLA